MRNKEFSYTQKTSEIKEGSLYAILWIVIMLLCTAGTLLERYEDPEPRKVHSIYSFRGHLIDMKPNLINEHCKNE